MAESIYGNTILDPHLQEIRILLISPKSTSTGVVCNLERGSLSDRLNFEALSYTWGDPLNKVPITLNHREFQVTENLSKALSHLRKETETVRIWIDAICINQDDNAERESQVRQMKEIYERAKAVIVWLGEKDEDSSYAIGATNKVDRRWASRSTQPTNERLLITPAFDERALHSINLLLSRSWWSRVWIIQEATCATRTDFRCGRDKTDFRAIVATANFISQHIVQNSLQQGFTSPDITKFQRVIALDQLRVSREPPTSTLDLLQVLENARTSNASDPKNKIFALSRLASGVQKAAVNLDYSMPLDRTYKSFTKSLIEKEQSLNILGHCQEATRDLQSWSYFQCLPEPLVPKRRLPSWCPDWSISLEATPFMKYEVMGDTRLKKLYSASGSFLPSVRATDNLDVLFIRGFTFDTVSKLGENFASLLNVPTIRLWYSWAEAELATTYKSTEEIREDFLHTLTADIGMFRGRCMRGSAAPWPIPDDMGTGEDSFVAGSLMRMAVGNRGIFISKKGLIGLGRFEVKEGDKICILHGGQMPFILRQEEHSYYFKGECYVHGLMDGECMKYPRVWEDFALH